MPKTKSQLLSALLADIELACTSNDVLDVDKYVQWCNEIAGALARRAQKKLENDARDMQAFVQANRAAYLEFRQIQEAERQANLISTEE